MGVTLAYDIVLTGHDSLQSRFIVTASIGTTAYRLEITDVELQGIVDHPPDPPGRLGPRAYATHVLVKKYYPVSLGSSPEE